MNPSLPADRLAAYLARQIENAFPDGPVSGADLARPVARALERLDHCFAHVRQRYYRQGDEAVFHHLNTDHYAAFLYLVGNTLHRDQGNPDLAAKTYALNKALHGLDLYYEVVLPDIFTFVHPVGTVIGRATFQDYFCVYQNCAVGGDLEGHLPELGRGVVLFAGSRAIGKSRIGDNCLLSAGTIVLGTEVPANSVVFGISPNLVCKPTRRDVQSLMFGEAAER
jgi:serine O-acetyltransferase